MVADGLRGGRPQLFRMLVAILLSGWIAAAMAQLGYEPDAVELSHPAINYSITPRSDGVAQLNKRLQSGSAALKFDGTAGYLRSLLEQLDVPIESQMVVFSRTSLQSALISPSNPRAIFFNDSIAVAWMRGGFIEVAAHDPTNGVGFYVLPQVSLPTPQLIEDRRCLGCHYSAAAEGVPGLLLRSIPTATDGSLLPWLGNAKMDHRTPTAERWGGWYVTGRPGAQHLGNVTIPDRRAQELPAWSASQVLTTLAGRFDTAGYLSEHSDVVALLVFEHQARMMNLITRVGWLARLAAVDQTDVRGASLVAGVNELADYMLFVDEALLQDVSGTSAFAERFTARGPRDPKGRSLRDFDLKQRLMRYPFSYMVYSAAFDALPDTARDMVYRRIKRILNGEEQAPRYAHVAPAREAVLEILRATKRDLPSWF